ncbi:unnamed protein product [Acanthocheilonema viteae]|uniref:Uncharacterized protein n=1 Tax=Acanthocheilonema viteae TaxID=6277 RepID=A0A498T0E6_ACAVI|nr:unnamed protein product [Acanthocheilonema viteae]
MRNSNSQTFGAIILLLVIIAIYCHTNMDENFVADIVPMDIFVAPTKSKQMRSELKEKDDIEMSLAISEITESVNYRKSSNLTIFGNDSSEIENTDNIIAFYDSRRISNHVDDTPVTILIAISGIAIMAAFGIGIN